MTLPTATPLAPVAIMAIAAGLGCSEGESGGSSAGSGTPSSPDELQTSCEQPDAPVLDGLTSVTVGEGTAESCTVAALQAALDEERAAIDFDCGEEVSLVLEAPLDIGADAKVSIDGGGAVTLDGGGVTRILQSGSRAQLILKGLTFQNAHRKLVDAAEGERDEGGALRLGSRGVTYVEDCRFVDNVADGSEGHGGGAIYPHTGHLTVVGSEFSGNRSALGGAIHNMLSNLTIVDSVFEDNEATEREGGAVFTDGAFFPEGESKGYDGLIHICGSHFSNNRAAGSGAAGFLFTYEHEGSKRKDRLVIELSEFRDNVLSEEEGLGGAIRVDADAQIVNSSFVGNLAGGQGGGIWLGRGPLAVVNSTFLGNEASQGGAIGSSSKRSMVSVLNCSFVQNRGGWGGALSLSGDEYQVDNSILAFNGEDGNERRHCSREPQGSNNLIFPTPEGGLCGEIGDSVDPLLELPDELDDVVAVAPASDSPAVGAGQNCPAIDQLGASRPQACTLGAVEAGVGQR